MTEYSNLINIAPLPQGQTGFPWIDAIMTQLREEGWIHHLARHAVACFLTRGDLWISWEEGMKVFEELLLDADWSVNAGMWMWLSCSSFFQQFFHCYCPVRFGRKADPNGDYIRKYLPVLKNYPTKYIHEPWVAPESVQKTAKCIIGTDYPVPIVNHAMASRINMERMKQVYQQLSKYRPNALGQIGFGIDDDPLGKGSKLLQVPTGANRAIQSSGSVIETADLLCQLASHSGERRRNWESSGFQMPVTRAAVDKQQVENTINYEMLHIETATTTGNSSLTTVGKMRNNFAFPAESRSKLEQDIFSSHGGVTNANNVTFAIPRSDYHQPQQRSVPPPIEKIEEEAVK